MHLTIPRPFFQATVLSRSPSLSCYFDHKDEQETPGHITKRWSFILTVTFPFFYFSTAPYVSLSLSLSLSLCSRTTATAADLRMRTASLYCTRIDKMSYIIDSFPGKTHGRSFIFSWSLWWGNSMFTRRRTLALRDGGVGGGRILVVSKWYWNESRILRKLWVRAARKSCLSADGLSCLTLQTQHMTSEFPDVGVAHEDSEGLTNSITTCTI